MLGYLLHRKQTFWVRIAAARAHTAIKQKLSIYEDCTSRFIFSMHLADHIKSRKVSWPIYDVLQRTQNIQWGVGREVPVNLFPTIFRFFVVFSVHHTTTAA